MAKRNRQVEEQEPANGEIPNGGPLPGEELNEEGGTAEEVASQALATATANANAGVAAAAPVLDFKPVGRDRDECAPFDRPILPLKEVGESFTGMFVANVLANTGEDELKFNAILMREFPSGKHVYIPAHHQLWHLFAEDEDKGLTKNRVYQCTIVEVKHDDKKDPEKVTFIRYEVKDAVIPEQA